MDNTLFALFISTDDSKKVYNKFVEKIKNKSTKVFFENKKKSLTSCEWEVVKDVMGMPESECKDMDGILRCRFSVDQPAKSVIGWVNVVNEYLYGKSVPGNKINLIVDVEIKDGIAIDYIVMEESNFSVKEK